MVRVVCGEWVVVMVQRKWVVPAPYKDGKHTHTHNTQHTQNTHALYVMTEA